MTLSEMVEGTRYIVTATKGSRGTLRKGDHLTMHSDKTVGCLEAGGWLERGEWEHLKAEVVVDREYHRAQAEHHREQAAHHKRIAEAAE